MIPIYKSNENDYHSQKLTTAQRTVMKNVLLAALLFPFSVCAAEADYTLVIKDHRFTPAELTIPAGKKIKLLVENQDSTPEEFESHSLNREKIIAGKGKITLYLGPLEAGSYPFFGEFNEATAKGVIIAK
jgi:plastocyanin